MNEYLKLAVAALLPVLLSVIFFLLDKKTAFGKLAGMTKQLIYGVAFGALAIVGTEWGIPIHDAQMNCRDAAVLTAGLMFGAPAGLFAGFIGGIERWFAVAWGVGTFTRTACSISTIIAGIYAALLRKFMFEDKKPAPLISLAIGVVMEVLHLTMVFITNMSMPTEAMAAVRACTAPMVVANGVSVMLASLVLGLLSHGFSRRERGSVRISQTIQRWLLVTVMLAFATTSYFVFSLQDTIAKTQTDSLLGLAVTEVADDISDASDENLLRLARTVAGEVYSGNLSATAEKYGLSDISLVDRRGIIVKSTEDYFLNYNMAQGGQSAEFLCLLNGTKEFVQEYGPISYDETRMRKYAGVALENGEGFVQIGYDAAHFQQDIAETVVGITKNRHVGRTGYILILDEKYNVVSAPRDFSAASLAEQVDEENVPAPDVSFLTEIGGEKVNCLYSETEGYYIVAVYPQAEAQQMRNIALYVNTFLEILVFAILFGLIYLLIKRVVVDQIKSVNASLARITGGDLDTVVDVRTNEEFASLSDDINSTVGTLKRYIAEASARIDQELEFAKDIQCSALPRVFPAFPKHPEFDIYAMMDTAREVGGDFYDFYLTGDDRLHFLIADVSGKGIPAAMFMMRAKTELKSLTETELPIAEVFERGNNALCEGNEADMFVTAWQGGLDLPTGRLTFANAGHNPPLLCRDGGNFEFVRTKPGLVLAACEEMPYRAETLDLAPGDTLFLYTDGVTEAQNAAGELYGEERLLRAVNSRPFDTVRAMCDFIRADVDAFVGPAEQFDDITMVALRYFGK